MNTKLAILVFCLIVAICPSAFATVPHLLAWQGVALDSLDVPLADGSYLFTFSIWSAGAGGDSLWGESRIINLENGVLNVLLGDSLPIPDSVFNLPNRWLQVQFESEAPYSPRTRIVSVGYAFRVNSLDGAQGGTVSSNIDLKAFATVPRFRVFREGTSTVIGELTGSGSGGRLTLYNGTGGKIVEMDPSTSPGGQFTLWTHPSNTTGIVMENTGNNNPYMLMQGQTTGALFNMDSVGDPSIILPPSAVSAVEMLDEPGLGYYADDATLAINATNTNLASRTITLPADGYVFVTATAQFNLTHTTGSGTQITLGVSDSAGFLPINQDFIHQIDASQASSVYFTTLTASGVFTATKGSHTFYFVARRSSGAGPTSINDVALTAIYFPTDYGLVSPPMSASSLAQEEEAAAPATGGTLDIEGEQAEARMAQDRKLARELAAMRDRLADLERRFQTRQDLETQDR